MAVTFARTGYEFGASTGTIPTPSGTGGVLVAFCISNDVSPTLSTPGDWVLLGATSGYPDQAEISGVWMTDVASPDMGVSFAGGGEPGLYCFRISDGHVIGSRYAIEDLTAYTDTHNPSDIAPSLAGVVVGLVGVQGSATQTNSAGLTEAYNGSIGASEWWAGTVAAYYGDIAPNGAAWDPGTFTLSTSAVASAAFVAIPVSLNTIATDDFNTLGTATLDSTADWETYTRSGAGVPTGDVHPDHSDGTTVVDMSNSGRARSIFQTPMGDADHWAQVQVFLDTSDGSNNYYGPMVRLSDSNPDNNATLDGYMGIIEAPGGGNTFARIVRIDNGTGTNLATSANIQGTYPRGVTHDLRLEVIGSQLTLYIDGVQILTTTDSTYTSGLYVGVQSDRNATTSDSQPFFDNFSAGDWVIGGGGGGSVINLRIGDVQPIALALGDVAITKAYLGDVLIVG